MNEQAPTREDNRPAPSFVDVDICDVERAVMAEMDDCWEVDRMVVDRVIYVCIRILWGNAGIEKIAAHYQIPANDVYIRCREIRKTDEGGVANELTRAGRAVMERLFPDQYGVETQVVIVPDIVETDLKRLVRVYRKTSRKEQPKRFRQLAKEPWRVKGGGREWCSWRGLRKAAHRAIERGM